MNAGSRRLLWLAAALVAILALIANRHREPADIALLLLLAVTVATLVSVARLRTASSDPDVQGETAARQGIAEALLATIPDPVILVDRRNVVIEANPAARALLPALKLRYPLSFALRAPDVLDGIEEVLRSGQPLKTTYAPRVPTERLFEVQIGALPMPDRPGGGQPNVVLFLRDLTSARRLETMRVDFVANASHELRTPLASLLGFIETLQGPARDDAIAREKFLRIMGTQALRMTRLIDDLLSLSRIELREHVAPTESVSLTEIAGQLVDAEAALALERGVELRFDEPEDPFAVLGDRDELMRVVENLVENAVKYGGSGGVVEIALRHLDGSGPRKRRVELSVRDAGAGIAPEHIPRLTERFYRVDTASSRQQGGTGLGLAIVKHALNRHGGRLAVESTIGQGTTVRVTLPEHVEEEPDARSAKA